MFENQPKGLWALALANTGERFGYYTMLAVFLLYLQANFGFETGLASTIYSTFLMMVYFLPIIGGIAADKFGFGRMVTTGIFIMFIGYLVLSLPLGKDTVAIAAMGISLILIALGTGLFKGNLQVMVGRLYDEPQYASNRDSGFSLFYMAINIGAMFAPTAAIKIMKWAQESLSVSVEDSYHFAFAVACASLIISIAIYYAFSFTYKHVLASETKGKDDKTPVKETNELSKAETKERIICLCLVFAVVIFFWMAFHQNGNTLTLFARDYTQKTSEGLQSMAFDVTNLVACIFVVYGCFGLAQSKTGKGSGFQDIDDQDRMMGRERTAALGDEVRVLDIALVGCIYECIDTVVHILLDRVVYGTLAAGRARLRWLLLRIPCFTRRSRLQISISLSSMAT